MKELEKVNLIKCKQCGMLHGEEVKHKCDNIRKAAYRQGKADAYDEIKGSLPNCDRYKDYGCLNSVDDCFECMMEALNKIKEQLGLEQKGE